MSRHIRAALGAAAVAGLAIVAMTGIRAAGAVTVSGTAGHPSQALDTACTLYLANTGDHTQ